VNERHDLTSHTRTCRSTVAAQGVMDWAGIVCSCRWKASCRRHRCSTVSCLPAPTAPPLLNPVLEAVSLKVGSTETLPKPDF
jgi:hypothetical protein